MTKSIAKTIIVSGPFSVEHAHVIPRWLLRTAERIDMRLQEWALAKSDSFSKKDWMDLQIKRLKAILIHAGTEVPYWKKVFHDISFDPNTISRFEDIEVVPISSRSQIQHISLTEVTAANIGRKRWIPAQTSGSTGEPLVFYKDTRDLFRRMIGAVHCFRFAGVPFIDPLLVLGLETHRQLDRLGYRFSNLENQEERVHILYPFIEMHHPQCLITTPSTLERFQHFLQKDGKHYSFRAIQCAGESFPAERRATAEQNFRAKIFSLYGSAECSRIAIECEKGQHHLGLWHCYVEVVDSSGHTLGPGKEGEIIVTGFENEVMPFIRYRLGDRGYVNNAPCACGRQSPTIIFTGRALTTIRTSADDEFSLVALSALITKQFSPAIAQYQLEQVSEKDFIFRYVFKKNSYDNLDVRLEKSLYELTGRNIKLHIKQVLEIIPAANGKTPLFLNSIGKAIANSAATLSNE